MFVLSLEKYKEKYLSEKSPYRQKHIRGVTINDILNEKGHSQRHSKAISIRPVTSDEYDRFKTKTHFVCRSDPYEETGIVRWPEVLYSKS